MSSYISISSDRLSRLLGTADAPTLIDVRIDDGFAADPCLIPGATRRSHLDVQDWAPGFTDQSIVICHTGGKLSKGTAAWPRHGCIAEIHNRPMADQQTKAIGADNSWRIQ